MPVVISEMAVRSTMVTSE